MSIEYTELGYDHLKEFEFEGNSQPVIFIETEQVGDGVECDVYTFSEDPSKDLGIIRIESKSEAPLQRVLQGTRTVEGHLSGEGQLTITRIEGNKEVYLFDDRTQKKLSVDVHIGDLMQWQAIGSSRLIAYEICFPPYQDGRYENIG